MIIYGPKGKGWFRLIFLQNSQIIPNTAPIPHDKKKASKTFFNPKTIPVIPNNFISPAPNPPRLTKIITAIIIKGTRAPRIGDHQVSRGFIKRSVINRGKKKNKYLYGINIKLI